MVGAYSITQTSGSDWLVQSTDIFGRHRYPKRIRVGSLDAPTVYVPERTCRDTSPMSYKFTCSECHSSYRFGSEHKVWYCPYCGAKVV